MEEKKSIAPISQEEFNKRVEEMVENNRNQMMEDFANGILHLKGYEGVKQFKSVRRAIKRGHCSIFGDVYPKRPFSNRKAKKGSLTYNKRMIYEQFKRNFK